MFKQKVRMQIAAALVALVMVLSASAAQTETAKNIILIIADGLSCNAIEATDLYNYFQLIYDIFQGQFGVSFFLKSPLAPVLFCF
jgi:alkaline phosphatase